MTLILTALCKNGVCVCADKRSKKFLSDSSFKIDDTLKKIHKFEDAPLIIFNHGINNFGSKSWKDLSTDFENSNEWREKDLNSISRSLRSFIEDTVVQQLEYYIRTMPNNKDIQQAAFVLCGKDPISNNYEFYELYWSPMFQLGVWKDTRLICSGEGEKYLRQYLTADSASNSVQFWRKANTQAAREKLKKLFSIALTEQKRLGGEEFSDNFDIKCISG
jgi:hypothetical protein